MGCFFSLVSPKMFSLSEIFCSLTIICLVVVFVRRRQWHPTPVFLLGESHGWRSLVGCSPWGRLESDTAEWLHFHFSLSCIGEGNGNPLQCSCLENPRDGGAWWAAVCGVAQSQTRLKWLSSSSSSSSVCLFCIYPTWCSLIFFIFSLVSDIDFCGDFHSLLLKYLFYVSLFHYLYVIPFMFVP